GRVPRAELARAQPPGPERLSEPARTSDPVLCVDRSLDRAAACRSGLRPSRLGFCGAALSPSSRPCHRQRRAAAGSFVRVGCDRARGDVGDLRHPHPAWDLMTPGARLSAAIEVIADIEARRRPAVDALKDWGLVHRFAGSADRAAIAGLGYDALRRRASSAHIMGDQAPRAVLLGMLRLERKLDCEAIAARADGGRFAPAPLSAEERARLGAADLGGAPPWVAGDYPQWLDPYFARVFGEARVAECGAPARPAPLGLRGHPPKART